MTNRIEPHTGPLRVAVVSSIADLESHARPWDELCVGSPERLPMSSHAYVRSYLEHLGSDLRWRCLFAYDGTALVGVCPLILPRVGESVLSGTRLHAPSDPHLPSVTILAASGFERAVLHTFFDELDRLRPRCVSVAFERNHELSCLIRARAAVSERCRVMERLNGYGSYLPITGTYEDYCKTLSHNFRRNLRRWERKLGDEGDIQFDVLSCQAITDDAFDEFLLIESSGWKGERGSAILCSPERTAFYRALLSRLRETGWAELHRLTLDGQLVAGQFGIRLGRTLVIWKIAYDERFAAYGPGNLLFEQVTARAFAQGDTDEINCLSDTPWHGNWKLASRPYYDLFLSPRNAAGYLLGSIPDRVAYRLHGSSTARKAYQIAKAWYHAVARKLAR